MKKLIIIILVLFSVQASAQYNFPSLDSLRRYINRFITNSAINAFTDYRLNTALNGMLRFIDSAGGGTTTGLDSAWALNDSTLRFRSGLTLYNVTIRGGRDVDTLWRDGDTLRYAIDGRPKAIYAPTTAAQTIQQVINTGNTISENDSINVDPSRSLTIHGGTGSSIILKALQSAVSHSRVVIQPGLLGLEYRNLSSGNIKSLTMSSLNGITVTDQDSQTGLGYAANYRTNGIANFGDRWIPDIDAVVDTINALAGGGGGGPDSTFKKLSWIDVSEFGAKPDGKSYSDGNISSGTAIFTSDSADFTAADVGKYFAVGGAGVGGTELITTIAGFTSNNTVTLTAAASTTVTSANFKFGTDNTTAIQNAINSACDSTTSTLYLHSGRYFLAGAPVTNVGGYNPNSQLYIPRTNYAPSADQKVFRLLGATPPNLFIDFAAGQSAPNAGTILESVITDSGACILNTIPDTAIYGIFNWRMLYIENVQFRNKSNDQVNDVKAKTSGVDLLRQNFVALKNMRIHTNSATESSIKPDSVTFGIRLPTINNGGNNQVDNLAIQGYFDAVVINENTNIDNLTISACYHGIVFDSAYHASNINRALVTWCPKKIVVRGGHTYFNITQLDIEHYSIGDKWFNDSVDLDERDAANSIGNIEYFIQQAYGGQSIPFFTRTGNYITSGIKATPIGGIVSHNFVNSTDQEARIGSLKTADGTFQLIVDGTGQSDLAFAYGGTKKWAHGLGLISGKNDWFLYNYTRAKVDEYIDTLGNFRMGGGATLSSAQVEPQFELIRADSSAIFHGKVTTNDNSLIFERQSSTFPTITWRNKAAGSNEKVWDMYANSTTWNFRTMSDDLSTAAEILKFTRSGTTPLYANFVTGNLAVGVPTPTEKFEVAGNGIFGSGVAKIGTLLAFTHAVEAGTDAGGHPEYVMRYAAGGSDEKNWDFYSDGSTFNLRTLNDAVNAAGNALVITRSGNTPQYFRIPTAAVGINVTSPTEKLEVGGNAVIGTTGAKIGTGLSFTHSTNMGEVGGLPSFGWHHSSAGSDAKNWEMYANGNDLVMRTLNDAVNNAANIFTVNRTGFGLNYFRHQTPVQLYGTGAGTGAWKWLVKNTDSSVAYINKNEVTVDSMTIAGFNISGRGFGGAPSMTTSSFMTFFNSSNLVIYEGVGTASTNYPKLRLTGSGSSAAIIYSGIFEALNRAPASGSQPLLITTTGDAISTNFVAGNIILRPGTNSVVNTAASAQFTNDSVLVDLNGSGRMIIEDNDAKYNRNNGSIFTARSLVDKGYVDSLTAISNGTSYTPTITSVTNVSATTLKGARYYRHGSFVEVRVYVSIDPTSVGSTEIAVSLPIASELAADDLFGSGNCGIAAQSGIVTTDATNNRATFIFSSTDTGAQDHVLIFSYPIILP